MSDAFKYKGRATHFNGLALKIQDYVRVPKNTQHFQYDMDKEFNKIFIEFLKSINVKHHKYSGKNATLISENHYKEFIAFFLLALSACKEETYLVELTFCDTRKPIQIIVKATHPPYTADIRSDYTVPMPKYEGYLNVCDVKTIKKIEDASND